MSDPNEIKKQTFVNSEDTPSEASKDLDEIKEKDLGKVSGGGGGKFDLTYADCL